MDFLTQIVETIDRKVESYTQSKAFRTHGLIHILPDDQLFPFAVNPQTNEPAVPDDKYDVSLYHRYEGDAFEPIDGRSDDFKLQQVSNMRLVAFGDRKRLQYTDFQFCQYLAYAILGRVNVKTAKMIFCQPVTSVTNALEVLNQELPGIEKIALDRIMLVSINYSVNINYNKSCLNLCEPKPLICK